MGGCVAEQLAAAAAAAGAAFNCEEQRARSVVTGAAAWLIAADHSRGREGGR